LAKERVSAQTKEKMLKTHFKEYDREEFNNQFIFGLQPVLDGQPFHSCMTKCNHPKNVSARASHTGNQLMEQFYDACLAKTKVFNHYNSRYEIDVLAETECHVMKKQISLLFLNKMIKEFKEKHNDIISLGQEDKK